MKKKLLAMLLVCSVVLGMIPAVSAADDHSILQTPVQTETIVTELQSTEPVLATLSKPEGTPDASGTWGNNLTWELYGTTLYISGEGEMERHFTVDGYPWGEYKKTVTEAIISDGITYVADDAFWRFENLTTVRLPDSITAIGHFGFRECANLKTINLPDSLSELGECCFMGTGLEHVELPSGVVLLEREVFADCANLKTIDLPDSLSELRHGCFMDSGLEHIELPSGVVLLEQKVFTDCANLKTVLIPDSTAEISETAFENTPNLTIRCYNMSFAHMYAIANEIPVEILEEDKNTPVYDISVLCGTGGTVAVAPNPSPANRYVLLQIQPEKGYTLNSLYYTCVEDPYCELTIEQAEDNLFVLLMPESDVELEFSFRPLESPFKDVKKSDYFCEPVLWAVGLGVTAGVGNGRFAPNDVCTRAQVVTFLWRAANEPEPTSTKNPFKDVKSTDYYYKAVLWAVENGITTGMTANTFGPNGSCTRGQVVTFLHRVVGEPDPREFGNPFKDVKSTDYYYEAVLWAADSGITTGVTASYFAPNSPCTRAQVVTLLCRLFFG